MLSILFIITSCSLFPFMLLRPVLDETKHEKNDNLQQNGYSFDAIINNVPVIELSNENQFKLLNNYSKKNWVDWQTMKAIHGSIKIEIKRHYIKEYNIGKIDVNTFKVTYLKLGEKENGEEKALDLTKEILLGNGAYIFVIQVKGSKEWDEKIIYTEIKTDENAQSFF